MHIKNIILNISNFKPRYLKLCFILLSFLCTSLSNNFFKVENAFFINKDQLYPLTWWRRTHFLWDYWDIMALHNGRFPIFATMKKKIIPSLSYTEKGVKLSQNGIFFSFAEFLFFIIFFFVKGRNKIVYNSRKNRSHKSDLIAYPYLNPEI